jgi:hypothetical protein
MIVMDKYEAFGGMRISREAKILSEKLPQYHFIHHRSHMT